MSSLEIEQEEGCLAVTIKSSAKGAPFELILEKLKGIIPKEERRWDSEEKRWLIDPIHLERLEALKKEVINDELSISEEEWVLDFQMTHLRDVSSLPPSMKARAQWAIEHLIKDTPDVKKEFSISRMEWGVYSQEEGRWLFESGRYSYTSPSGHDRKVIEQAYKRLDQIRKSGHEAYEFSIELDARRELRGRMLEKYNYVCFICSIPDHTKKLEMHRVIPGKQGGEYAEDNIVMLCRGCHRRVEGLSWDAIRKLAASYEE